MSVSSWLMVSVVLSVVSCQYKVCNVYQEGGVGDGTTDNTALLRKLFSECDEVIVPYGQTYLTHPLNATRDNFALILQGTLLFYDMSNLTEWPVMPHLPSYPCDRDQCSCCRYQPLVLVWKVNNFTLQGEGTLNGQGQTWWDAYHQGALTYGRPRMFETMYASKVKILDVNMVDSPFWTCHPYSTEGVYIEGVSITAPNDSPNTDGFDPDSCSYVHIKNCYVYSGDDCVAIKSGMDEAGLEYNQPSEHIFISNLKCDGGHGVSIGSEMSGGVSDVIVANMQSSRFLQLKTAPSRGGYIEDVTFLNIQVIQAADDDDSFPGVLRVQTNYPSPSPPSPNPPVINNIRYEGITGRGAHAGVLTCTEEIPCTNFVAVDVHIEAKHGGFQCSNVTTASQFNVFPQWCGDDGEE